MDYRGIRVWHVHDDLPGNWRELQKRAWCEGAPLDALYVDYAGRWICARDLAADHWIHAALASDREHCRARILAGCGGSEHTARAFGRVETELADCGR